MAGKTDFTAETEDGLRQNGTLSLAGWVLVSVTEAFWGLIRVLSGPDLIVLGADCVNHRLLPNAITGSNYGDDSTDILWECPLFKCANLYTEWDVMWLGWIGYRRDPNTNWGPISLFVFFEHLIVAQSWKVFNLCC